MDLQKNRRLVLGLGLMLLVVLLSVVIFERLFQTDSAAVRPENLDRLDPNVASLIEDQILPRFPFPMEQ